MFFKLVAAFCAVVWISAAGAASPAENFVKPVTTEVSVSPSGAYIAVITAIGNDKKALAIAPFKDGQIGKFSGTDLGDAIVMRAFFKTDDRLIVTILQRHMKVAGVRNREGQDMLVDRTLVVAINRDGSDMKVMMPDNEIGASVISGLRQDPDHVLLQATKASYHVNLYRANIHTGEVELVEEGSTRREGMTRKESYIFTTGWEVTPTGVPYIRQDYNEGRNTTIVYGRAIGGSWTKLTEFPNIFEAREISFEGMASERTAYLVYRANEDRRAIWEFDLVTGKPVRKVFSDPAGEIDGLVSNVYKGAAVGYAVTTAGKTKWVYQSKPFAAAQAVLEENFPNYPNITIRGYSQDLGVYSVYADGPSVPPVYILLDARTMSVSNPIAVLSLDASGMGEVRTLTWPSSDGRIITGYLALPAGASRNVPLIVMPHGGPESQDDLSFDPWRQFLVSRGYAVFQPQFRGGDSFGAAHEKAGHGQWGKLVQDDVTTGVARLIADGIADPKRMCIFGWSYGGYMALAGATFSPDLYNCVVAGAPVADVDSMLAWEGERYGRDSQAFSYWLERMGDVETRKAASPARFAANVKAPLLLIHGDRDLNVPYEQSEIMEAAMVKAGKPVEFLKLPDERHTPFGPAMIKTLNAIEAFLAKHING
ncbi:MAG: prolyl oligopeptidase family serine peptidase [Micropepsaceae bacterium]